MEKRIRVGLADDDIMFRTMCRNLIDLQLDMEVVGEAADPAGVHAVLSNRQPDVLVLSARIGGQEGFRMLRELQAAKGNTRVIAVCEHGRQDEWVRAAKLGCRGVLPANSTPEAILKSVRKVYEGELWLDRATTAEVLRQLTHEVPGGAGPREGGESRANPLSPREREIVSLVSRGFKNRELAEKLTISEQTVKNHMHNIFDKLGVSDRLELALYAIHNGLR